MKARTRALVGPERDRAAYALAKAHVLEIAGGEITADTLESYLKPESLDVPRTLQSVYYRLLQSAQNKGMMSTVIGRTVGGLQSLSPVLEDFSPKGVTARFASADDLLDTVIKRAKPTGKLRRAKGSLWPLFARSAISGARFLGQFQDGPEFISWVQTFDADPRKRAALPLLISQEIHGFGFALACDFLKELGFSNFAKPDVHIKALAKGLGLCASSAGDYEIFNAIVRVAASCDRTPYDVDKVFWLVGSGYFYGHPHVGRNGRLPTDRDRFVKQAIRTLGVTR